MKLFSKPLSTYFELAARIYAFTMLTVYGTGKIAGGQFYQDGNIPEKVAGTPLSEVGGFDLAWTFFGYSEGYILFIGLTQLLGAFLLLFERTKLLGVVMLIPVLLNIIVVDFFFSISTGAMLSAISYLTAVLFVAFINRDKIINAINTILIKSNTENGYKQKALQWGIAILIVAITVALENQMLNIVGR